MKVNVYECTGGKMLVVPAGTSVEAIKEILSKEELTIKPQGVQFSKDLLPQQDPTAKSPFGITPDEAIAQIGAKGYAISGSKVTITETIAQVEQ